MLSATSHPRQSPTANKIVDHVRGDSPVPFDSCSQHSNISRQHSFTSCESVALNVFKMAASIPKRSPSWCHLWATEGINFFKRSTAVGLLLRSSSLRGSAKGEGVGITVGGRRLHLLVKWYRIQHYIVSTVVRILQRTTSNQGYCSVMCRWLSLFHGTEYNSLYYSVPEECVCRWTSLFHFDMKLKCV